MKSYLAAAISIWVILIEPSLAADLSFDVGSATKASYSKLLTDVRDKVKDPNLKYGGTNIPVIAAPASPAQYLLIDLKADDGGIITIALSKAELYLYAYQDKINGNFRAHFFKDAPSDAKTKLFPDAKGAANRIEMKYTTSYADIEKNAGSSRTKIGLGVKPLNKYIKLVFGKPLKVQDEATLMLIVIQTISEAARFKFIENMILNDFDSFNNFPGNIAIELQKSWQKITKGIKSSKNGVISPKLELRDASNKVCVVTKVDFIAKHMGLLKYEGKAIVVSLQESLLSDDELLFFRFVMVNGYDNGGVHGDPNDVECNW